MTFHSKLILQNTHKYSYIPNKRIKTNHTDNTANGGITIFNKFSILFQVLQNFYQDFLQSCAILTKFNCILDRIAAIYFLPKHNLTNSSYLNYFITFSNNFIIEGDYNTNHQS